MLALAPREAAQLVYRLAKPQPDGRTELRHRRGHLGHPCDGSIEDAGDFRAASGARGLRRIAVVIVNARSAPRLDFDKMPYGPGTFALLMQSVSVPMNRYSIESVAALP